MVLTWRKMSADNIHEQDIISVYLPRLVPYGRREMSELMYCDVPDPVSPYREANSANVVKVARLPAHTIMKEYTMPAGPPLMRTLISKHEVERKSARITSLILFPVDYILGQYCDLFVVNYFTDASTPSQVDKMTKERPRIETNPKFRYGIYQLAKSTWSCLSRDANLEYLDFACSSELHAIRRRSFGFRSFNFRLGLVAMVANRKYFFRHDLMSVQFKPMTLVLS